MAVGRSFVPLCGAHKLLVAVKTFFVRLQHVQVNEDTCNENRIQIFW